MLQQTIKKNSGISKHVQLKQIIMEMIVSDYEPGARFLSERKLMKEFKVSSTTVVRALKALVEEGILDRRGGGGTFIKNISNIKLQKPSYNDLPTLIFSSSHRKSAKSSNPLHWFINSEINNGIMSNYPGRCLMKSIPEILAGIKDGSKLPIILVDPALKDIEEIDAASVPYVIINQNINTQQIPKANSIRWECLTGIHHLIANFAEAGHKKIAMISGKLDTHTQRINGFKFNMQEFNLELRHEYMIEALGGYEANGYQAMEQLLNLQNPPTAVFVDTDIKAEGAIRAVLDRKLKIPDDIVIAGFDDIPDAAEFTPAITTIRVPYFELGLEAVKMIQEIMDNNYPQTSKIVHTELIVRDTTGILAVNSPGRTTSKYSIQSRKIIEQQLESCYA
jgi:DNA-binding transcriptional regulator YhcF (GntR family)